MPRGGLKPTGYYGILSVIVRTCIGPASASNVISQFGLSKKDTPTVSPQDFRLLVQLEIFLLRREHLYIENGSDML
jgi:hypothetical protein